MTRVQLIQPTTGPYRSNSRTGCYAPLGLVSIATYVRSQCPDTDIEIIDGELVTQEEILQRLDADIVGISTNAVTYPQAIETAETAKERGAKVVLGGVYASAIPDLILHNRGQLVDHLVVGYGEKPMVDIIRGVAPRLIVNHKPPLDLLLYPNRSPVDANLYIEAFRANHPTWNHRATNIFTNLGCEWKAKSDGGCIFCSRSGQTPAYRDGSNIWREVRELVEHYKVDYLVDFSDTTLQNLDVFGKLVRDRPVDLNPDWHIFARMDELTPQTVKLASQLPCRHMFVGIESGDPERYKAANKMAGSPAESLAKARLLNEYDIALTPSYVIGLPGETEESLQTTLEHAYRLRQITGFEEIFCCQLIPFPGSVAFQMLRKRYAIQSDMIDVQYLKRLWADTFCSASFCEMERCVNDILSLGEYRITISRSLDAGDASAGNRETERREGLMTRESESSSVHAMSKPLRP